MKNLQHGGQIETRVVNEFNAGDMGAPFTILLMDAVTEKIDRDTGEQISYTIPDPDGLARAVVFARILCSRKLSGPEIKWLRKAVGVKQKDIAHAISMTPEHLSRCEGGSMVMSGASEKLLRLFLFKMAVKHHKLSECEAKAKIEEALDRLFDMLEPVSAFDIEDQIVFRFYRRPAHHGAGNDNDDDGGWDDLKHAIGQ